MAMQNQDGSFAQGERLEVSSPFAAHQIGVPCVTVAMLTLPGVGENQVIIQADGNDIRFRLDGTNPTASVGMLLKNGTSITLNKQDATALKFIQVAATAVLNAWYTK